MDLVFITGGGGSLGAELAKRLSHGGRSVRVFDLPDLNYSQLKEIPSIEVFCGNIADKDALRKATRGAGTVIHLASLLPPIANDDQKRTELINVEGTANLIEAVKKQNREVHFIFSSSVAVYGNTTRTSEPLSTRSDLNPGDFYARSKVLAENLVIESKLPYTVLRISGVAVPCFLEPPTVWPFMRGQRIEFVCRDDVVTAIYNCVENRATFQSIFNIAGGELWRMSGHQYVEPIYELMGVPPEAAEYLEQPSYFDWYDTADSQAVLKYQNTTHQSFLSKLEQALRTF